MLRSNYTRKMEEPKLQSSRLNVPPSWSQSLDQKLASELKNVTLSPQLRSTSCVTNTLLDTSVQQQKLLKRKPSSVLPCSPPAIKTRLLNNNLLDASLKKELLNLKNDHLKNATLSLKNLGLRGNLSSVIDTSVSSSGQLCSKNIGLTVPLRGQLNNQLLLKPLSDKLNLKSDILHSTKNVLLQTKSLCSMSVSQTPILKEQCLVRSAESSLPQKREPSTVSAKATKRFKRTVCPAGTDQMPRYSFTLDQSQHILKPVPNFNVTTDPITVEAEARIQAKLALLHSVSSSLISGPNMKDRNDGVRLNILERCKGVAEHNPEFVLKVALYTRNELNIRTTTNLLLAFSAYNHKCRRYLAKYFCASVRLPSDWLDIAEQYQLMHDENLKVGSLPAALRRVMVIKFAEFDEYQLAKYNREKKKPKKAKEEVASTAKQPEAEFLLDDFPAYFTEVGDENFSEAADKENGQVLFSVAAGGSGVKEVHEEEVIDEEEADQYVERKFTLKQLVRLLHVTRPAEHVMALIGKKYPSEIEKFRESGLFGYWEEERSGKRMKLPTPETWETQVSLKGNKASTWKDLIDNRKLPFMAMLRNLRNMILAAIPEKHHAEILKTLTNEKAVEKSRQFPFRFLSAYDVLNDLKKKYLAGEIVAHKPIKKNPNYKGKNPKAAKKSTPYNVELLDRYRTALNEAIRLATLLNVPPIPGTTIVLLDVNRYTDTPCTSARGLGKPRTVREVALLLGLMCQAACENSTCVLYAKSGYHIVEPSTETLLEQISVLQDKASELTQNDRYDAEVDMQDLSGSSSTKEFLDQLLHDRVQVNNLLVLSNASVGDQFAKFLPLYRKMVNPQLLFVSVDLSAKSTNHLSNDDAGIHPNNVRLSGFSDQLLRFVAERGSSQQLDHVENIDVKYNLDNKSCGFVEEFVDSSKTHGSTLTPNIRQPIWRSVRIFISSTFRDMHGERDLLVRYIFPELRDKARSLFLDVHEVDLRWGITEHEAEENKALQVCLQEASRCDIFIGMLGERYGHIPNLSDIPLTEEFDWVRQYSTGASITELEFHAGALSRPATAQPMAFVYIRDDAFMKSIPFKWKSDFEAENSLAQEKVKALKKKVLQSSVSVYNEYPCQWGGVVGGRPIVSGLEDLGQKVLGDIWKSLVYLSKDDSKVSEETSDQEILAQNMAVERHCDSFVGQKRLVEQCVEAVTDKKMALIILSGKSGSGKTAILAHLLKKLKGSLNVPVAGYFINATPNSNSVGSMLRFLCQELCLQMKKSWSPQPNVSESHLVAEFVQLLHVCIKQSGRLVLIVDNLDGLESDSMLTWLPDPLPQGLIFVGSVTHGAIVQKTLILRDATFFSIQPLNLPEKNLVVKQMLSPYRKVLTDTLFNNQLRLLVSKSEAGRPLYLYMASRQLRIHGSFEQMTELLEKLPPTLDGLLKLKLGHLQQIYGTEIVSVVLGLLSNASDGLLEEELWGMMNLYWSMKDSKVNIEAICDTEESPDSMLPPVIFGQLIRDMEGLLARSLDLTEPVLSLSHGEVIKVVRTYFKQETTVLNDTSLHTLMAGFYLIQADPVRNGLWLGQSPRPFIRVIRHLLAAGCHRKAYSLLTDLKFLYAKSRLGIAATLLEDFSIVQTAIASLNPDTLSKYRQYQQFVTRNHHILTSCPTLLLQQALNEPSCSAPALDSEQLLGSSMFPSALQWLNKPITSNACLETIVHTEPVTSVAVASSEPLIAFGMQSGSVHLYNVKTGKEGFVFSGHTDLISMLTFVGAFRLCSASNDGTLSLWDLQTGNRVAVMKGHRRRVSGCCCDSDVTMIVSSSWDCTLRTWHPRSGLDVSTMKEKHPINCVSLHPNRLIAAIGLWDCTLRFWDLQTMKRKAILRGHTASVKCLSFSPCGDFIVSASLNGEVRLWSAAAGFQINAFESHKSAINSILFWNDGSTIVTASDDHSLKVWESIFGSKRTVYRCDRDAKLLSLEFCDDGGSLMVVDNSSRVAKVNFETGSVSYVVKPSTAYVTSISSGMDKNWVALGYSSGELKLIHCDSGATLANMPGSEEAVTAVLCRKTAVVAGTSGGTLLFYMLPSKLSEQNCCDVTVATTVRAHFGQVTCIIDNQADKLIATMSRDKAVKLWSVSGTKKDVSLVLISSLEACHSDWINAGAWISEKKRTYLVTGSNDCTVKLWNVDIKNNTLKEVKTLGSMPAPIVHISVWDTNVVCGSLDGTIQMFTKKGAKVVSIKGETSKYFSAIKITSPSDSKDWYERVIAEELGTDIKRKQQPWPQVVLAVACEGGVVKAAHLFDENHGQTFSGHSDRVLSTVSLWDGRLVSCSWDHTARIWQCDSQATGSDDQLTATHTGAVTAIDWCKKRELMLSSDESGAMIVWRKGSCSEMPTPKASVMAHSNSITDACFTIDDQLSVGMCTVSADGCMSLWTWDLVTSIKKVRRFQARNPLACVRYLPSKKIIVAGGWNGITVICDARDGEILNQSWNNSVDWFLKVAFDQDNETKPIWASYSSIGQTSSDDYAVEVRAMHLHNFKMDSAPLAKQVMSQRQGLNLPTCLSIVPSSQPKNSTSLFLGLSNGKVVQQTLLADKQVSTFCCQMHKCEVTACEYLAKHNLLLTASRDCLLKLWRVLQTGSFHQVAQYECMAPVTCLSVLEEEDGLVIACGDSHGHIDFIKWLNFT